MNINIDLNEAKKFQDAMDDAHYFLAYAKSELESLLQGASANQCGTAEHWEKRLVEYKKTLDGMNHFRVILFSAIYDKENALDNKVV